MTVGQVAKPLHLFLLHPTAFNRYSPPTIGIYSFHFVRRRIRHAALPGLIVELNHNWTLEELFITARLTRHGMSCGETERRARRTSITCSICSTQPTQESISHGLPSDPRPPSPNILSQSSFEVYLLVLLKSLE